MADSAASKPKKKPFLTVGVPGARRTLGGGTTGGKPAVFQPNLLGTMSNKTPVKKLGPVTAREIPLGPAPAGRPPTNLGKYLISPTDNGYEMLNSEPDVLTRVDDSLRKFELPDHLRPTRFLSPVLEHERALAISRGQRAPQSRSR